MPLSGDPSLTSSFGYRVDPFLGRLALHPGVDLAEPYGAEIHPPPPDAWCTPDPRAATESWSRSTTATASPPATRTCRKRWSKKARKWTRARPGPPRLDRPLDWAAFALRSARRWRAGRSRALSPRRRRAHGGGIAASSSRRRNRAFAVLFPGRAAKLGRMEVALLFRALSLLGLRYWSRSRRGGCVCPIRSASRLQASRSPSRAARLAWR